MSVIITIRSRRAGNATHRPVPELAAVCKDTLLKGQIQPTTYTWVQRIDTKRKTGTEKLDYAIIL